MDGPSQTGIILTLGDRMIRERAVAPEGRVDSHSAQPDLDYPGYAELVTTR